MIELYQSNEKKKKYNKKSFPDGRILRKQKNDSFNIPLKESFYSIKRIPIIKILNLTLWCIRFFRSRYSSTFFVVPEMK